MKYLFLVLIFHLSALNAAPIKTQIELDYSHTSYEDFNVGYVKDVNGSLTLDAIAEMKFTTIKSQNAFMGSGTVWYKIKIKNLTQTQKKSFLHNDLAYFSKTIDIYELQNGKLFKQSRYKILNNASNNKLIGSSLIHPLSVPPNSEITLYVRNVPMVSALVKFCIYDERESLLSLNSKTLFGNVIILILFTLAASNLILYFFNARREFLFYSLYLFNASVGLSYMYGSIFDYLGLYGEMSYWFNLSAILVSAFLVLFIKELLNSKLLHKKINSLLNTILYAATINVLIFFTADFTTGIEVAKLLFGYSFLVIAYLAYYLLKTGHPLARIFLGAYAFYILGMVITLLAMSNVIPLSSWSFHASGVGLVLEAILFSYLVHYQIKLLENEIREQREIIITKNKKAQLGDMISAITHQWKQPLTRISSITSLMDEDSSLTPEELKENISKVDSNVRFLSETIDDFKDFFNPTKELMDCDLSVIVQSAIALSVDDASRDDISIKTDLNFKRKIKIYKNELLHIILNILQNSKEAFKNNAQDVKLIKIIGYEKEQKIYIDVIDNAGGIKEENLPFIFNEHYTTKEKKTGSGLGLYLSKVILEDHLKGSIEVKNIQGGAMFRIVL